MFSYESFICILQEKIKVMIPYHIVDRVVGRLTVGGLDPCETWAQTVGGDTGCVRGRRSSCDSSAVFW